MLEQAPDKVKSTTLVLPFSISTRERALPFTEEMEEAVVFTLTQSDRKKGEGLLFKKVPEDIVLIAKSYYPVWLVPWNGQTLCFDGLGVSTRIILYDVLPEIKSFINDIQGSASTRQVYSATLQDHLHYFGSMKRVEQKTFLGLVTSPDFLEGFRDFLTEAEESEHLEIGEVCLTPIVEEAAISSALDELSELHTTLEGEVHNLREAMKLINTVTRRHADTIRAEIKEMQSDLNLKIAEAKTKAMEKISQIQEKYDARILRTSQRLDKQLEDLHQDRMKLEKSQERAIEKNERCDTEIQTSKARKDPSGEKRWKDERETWRREASTLKKSAETLDKQIEQTESQKKVEISNVRSEFSTESEEAMKDVRELEASRDSKTRLGQQEAKSLEDLTSTILGQLDALTKKKRTSLEELDRIGMKDQRRKKALAFVPFYLSCFKADARRRYVVYPPSFVGSMKATTKLKGMFGMSKLSSLFQPRSKSLANVLNQVITLAARDPVYEKDLYDAGTRSSILRSAESREAVVKGLNELRNEQWFSVAEVQNLTASLKH